MIERQIAGKTVCASPVGILARGAIVNRGDGFDVRLDDQSSDHGTLVIGTERSAMIKLKKNPLRLARTTPTSVVFGLLAVSNQRQLGS